MLIHRLILSGMALKEISYRRVSSIILIRILLMRSTLV
nr:MAG TPA: hypothetical protein [Crassvirales sp.]